MGTKILVGVTLSQLFTCEIFLSIKDFIQFFEISRLEIKEDFFNKNVKFPDKFYSDIIWVRILQKFLIKIL